MRNDEIDADLVDANPWWRDPDVWTTRDVQLRRARQSPLVYTPRPLAGLTKGGLYILRGPRRVGKSTALKQLVTELMGSGVTPRRILHISVEGRSDQDLTDIVRRGALEWLKGDPGDRYWLIDEITGVHGSWPAAIKRLRDNHPSFAHDTVVLTGSSSAGFDEARKLLAGRRNARNSDRVLFQMAFPEVAEVLGYELPTPPEFAVSDFANEERLREIASEYRPWIPTFVDAWDRYLQVGGYPQAVAAEIGWENDEAIGEALWDVIHGDAFAGSGLTQTQTQSILRRLSSSLGSLLSVNAIADAINVDPKTAAGRLDALRRGFIAFPVPREQGLAPRPKSQSKWYFTDPALARLASTLGAGQAPDPTVLSEQQLAMALLRALEKASPGAAMRHDRLLHYRSSTKAEIDFVAPDFAQTCFESKFVDRAWGRAFQTIEASGRRSGVVATRSGLQQHRGGWALPAGLVAHLLAR